MQSARHSDGFRSILANSEEIQKRLPCKYNLILYIKWRLMVIMQMGGECRSYFSCTAYGSQ